MAFQLRKRAGWRRPRRAGSRPRRLTAESLEPRMLLAALTPGNILVTNSTANESSLLYEFTVDGTEVQRATIPSSGIPEQPRDVVVDSNGEVQIYNGTFRPTLATFDPANGTFDSHDYAEWSTVNNLTYGGMAAAGDFVFATDMATVNGAAKGVIRVDIDDFSMQRFATALNPIDVNIGLDGLLYVLNSGGANAGGLKVHVFNPSTMIEQRVVTLPREHRAIAVDLNGDIFATNPDIYHYDKDGVQIGQPFDRNFGGASDIDIDLDGRVLVVSHGGDIGITDTGFKAWTQFTSRPANGVTFATFVSPARGFPKAFNDTFTVKEQSSDNVLRVLDNDQSTSGNLLQIQSVSTPDHQGKVTIAGDTLLYTPATEFTGFETFSYTINNGVGGTDTAHVTMRVTAVATLIGADDQYTTPEDTQLIVPAGEGLLVNDSFGTGPLTPGNILISNSQHCCEPNMLYEYTPTGVRQLAVELPKFGSTELSRDLVMDRNGNIQIWNGTFSPRLTNYNPVLKDLSHQFFAGWSTVNNLTFGGASAYGDFVLASDTMTAGDIGSEKGVIRFNVKDLTVTRFAETEDNVIDVTVGWDGLAYLLTGSGSPIGRGLQVYDPVTMQKIRTVTLPRLHRAIIADAAGNIYGVSDKLYKYSPTGTELANLDLELGGLADIDASKDGKLLIASHGGDVALTDTDFSSLFKFTSRVSNGVSFAAFVQQPPGVGTSGLQVKSNTQPPNGTVAVNADGSFTYTPDLNFTGQDTFTYVVEDGQGGETQATVRIDVTSVNDAPKLLAGSPFGTTTEDNNLEMALSQFINNGVGTTSITDADANDPVGGIAVYHANSPGTWEYSTNGLNYTVIGDVSEDSALLLRSVDFVRFVPEGDNGGTAELKYYAWDTTSGAVGDKVDVTTRGGQMAFSTDGDVLTFTITDVNDAPVLTPAAPDLGTTDEETPIDVKLSDFVTGIQDVDNGAVIGGIAIIGAVGNGNWSYSTNGTDFNSFPGVSNSAALLLEADDLLRYTPDTMNGESASITYRAWDTTSGQAGQTADTSNNGGSTAFSTVTDTGTLTVTNVNDAPVLTPTAPSMGNGDEENIFQVQLSAFVTGIADVDQGAEIGGIALTGSSGNGRWFYSLDGSGFINMPSLSETAALLLEKDDWLRYIPDFANGETATLTYRAWDATAGTAGTAADTTTNGDTTAFSVATDTTTLTLDPVNDAPVLTPASPSMGVTDEHTPIDVQLSNFVTGITDVDQGAKIGGIALTATSGNGAWSYSLNGTDFQRVGTVTVIDALLLDADDWLRYEPQTDNADLPQVTYRAWDATAGEAGQRASTTPNGGSTAFSTAIDTATLTVNGVNDAPVLGAEGPQQTTDEDTSINVNLPSVINTPEGAGTKITDVDQGDVVGGIAVTQATGGGVWKYSLDGNSFLDLGTVSETAARLLPEDAIVRYEPTGQNAETATITYRAWDQTAGTAGETGDTSSHGGQSAFSTDTDVLTINVNAVNDAPVLTAAGPDKVTLENTLISFSVDSFINSGPDTTIITDVDNGSLPAGIAITGSQGGGVFTYSLDGSTFVALGKASLTNALLLPPTAQWRYQPLGENGETATLSYRGWDRSTGSDGQRADVSNSGGSTAFSVDGDTLTIEVQDVNDPPTGITLNPSSVDENLGGVVIGQLTAQDPDNGDSHTFSITDDRFVIDGDQLKVKPGSGFDHEVTPSVNLQVTATDSGGLQVNRVLAVTINDVNERPELSNPLEDQQGFVGARWSLQFPADTFSDPDDGDSFTYGAKLVNGDDLPAWISFDSLQRQFTGIPPQSAIGTHSIRLTATDNGGLTAEDVFDLSVEDNPFPWQNPLNRLDVNNDGRVTGLDALLVINHINRHPGNPSLPDPPAAPPPFLDVTGDDLATPRDVLLVMNFINQQAGGEGEAHAARAGEPLLVRFVPQHAARSETSPPADTLAEAPELLPAAGFLVGEAEDQAFAQLDWEEIAESDLEDLLEELGARR